MPLRSAVFVVLAALLALAVPAAPTLGEADSSRQVSPEPTRRAAIRVLSPRVTKRGVKVRMTIPLRTPDGIGRARLWTANMGVLLGQRDILVLQGTRSRTFYLPLNRRGKRMVKRGRMLVRATARVPAPIPD